MEQEIEITSSKSIDSLKEETLNYFEGQGFQLVDNQVNCLEFKRGSIIKNMITFNPLKWKSHIKIQFEEETVIAIFKIDTVYQIVTPEEHKLWNRFIENYQKTIETGKLLIHENQLDLENTKRTKWKYIGHAVLGSIIIGIPCGIISYYTGNEIIAITGAVAGGVIFMMNKISKEERNAT